MTYRIIIPFLALLSLTVGGCKQPPDSSATPATPTKPGAPDKKPGDAAKPSAADVPAPSDVAAAPSDATKTASGLAYKVLTKGTGTEKPNSWDSVKVNYTGWTTDGKMFDSTTKRNRPARFGLKQVIPGWTEGLALMTVGEKTRFWIPVELAYNKQPGKPAGMLVFDVELLEIIAGKKPIAAPADVAAPSAGHKKTASGMSYKVLTPGKGKKPRSWDQVEVHYTGWTKDGAMFDSSVQRGRTTTFGLDRVIKGWTEGVQLMAEGEKTRFWIPAALAYGDKPSRPGAPVGDLTFDIELVKVIAKPAPPKAPSDVAAAPKGAKKTASGLAYKTLSKGKGKVSPKPTDRVEVHYSGWTTDGKMFDSSVPRGKPATFGVNRVIKGWTEGLQLMHEGDKFRFWIPAELAYGKTPARPGAPAGMLVFDVELLHINPKPAAGGHGHAH